MDPAGAAIIDFTEMVYDLGVGRSEWLPRLLEAGSPFIDHGLGCAALTCRRDATRGALVIEEVSLASCSDEFLGQLASAYTDASRTFLWNVSTPALPMTLSEAAGEDHEEFARVMRHFAHAEDGLGLSAFDPDGSGVYLVAPLRARTTLSDRERDRWQMVAAHFGAGNRLRTAIRNKAADSGSTLPLEAEAVIDAKNFRVSDATGNATGGEVLQGLREAAMRVDEARGQLRRLDPHHALESWSALVRGRWSMVDWFDSDSRRYVLAVPNGPNVDDPRGLTKREAQVVSYVVSGHPNKLIAYQLGVSKARVSALVSSSMRKLNVRTRAELITTWRNLGDLSIADATLDDLPE